MKHKGSDYKISAVKYHLSHKSNLNKSHKASLNKTCKIFNCKKSTLRRWILRYKDEIEMYFNQLKTYMKKIRNVKSIQELEMNVENSIKQSNYKNYFDFVYGDKTQFSYTNKSSTRKRKQKLYKL